MMEEAERIFEDEEFEYLYFKRAVLLRDTALLHSEEDVPNNITKEEELCNLQR